MQTRTTAILAGVAVVVFGLGWYYGMGSGEQGGTVAPGQLAFPTLASRMPDAMKLEVAHHGTTLLVVRKGDIWDLPDKGGYPALPSRVHELLAGLSELRLQEPRTADPREYSRLGVEAPGKDADSTEVRLLDAKGAPIAALIVGHQRTTSSDAGDSLYVRRPDAAQAWLATGPLSVETDPQQWLDTDIVNIPHEKVAGVVVTRDGDTLDVAREGDGMHVTAPADHPKLDQVKVDDVGRALENLTLLNVKPSPAPGTTEGQSVFTTTDGMTVTVTVSKSGPDVWAQLSASGKDKAQTEAAALDKRVKGWAYQIDGWKEQALVPTLASLKAPSPPATAKAPASPAASPVPAAPAAK